EHADRRVAEAIERRHERILQIVVEAPRLRSSAHRILAPLVEKGRRVAARRRALPGRKRRQHGNKREKIASEHGLSLSQGCGAQRPRMLSSSGLFRYGTECARVKLMTSSQWPPLPLAEWRDTRDTLQMWTQIAGKIALALTPRVNHFWNAALQIGPRGLQTLALPCAGRSLTLAFDFVGHELVIVL